MSKNCIFCGAEIDDDDLFCGECGKKQDPEEKKRIEQAEAEAKAKAEAEMRLKREQAEREAQQRQAQIDKETEMRIRAEAEAKAKYEHEAQIKREQAEQERLAAEQKKLAKEQVKNSPERKATIGMILGICCIVFAFTGFVPVLLFIPGLVYSIKGLKGQKKGQAITGIVCNGLILLIVIFSLIAGWIMPPSQSSTSEDSTDVSEQIQESSADEGVNTQTQPNERASIENDTEETVNEELPTDDIVDDTAVTEQQYEYTEEIAQAENVPGITGPLFSDETDGGTSSEEKEADTQDKPYIFKYAKNVGEITKSVSQYEYNKNPYYKEGLQKYVDFYNSALAAKGSKQKLEVMDTEKGLADAGISWGFRKKLMALEGTDISKSKDFKRVAQVKDSGFLASFKDDWDITRYVVSGSNSDKNGYFYYGKLKKDRPNGEGAIFLKTDYGAILQYAGKFSDGQYSGNGVKMSEASVLQMVATGQLAEPIANIPAIKAKFKKNLPNGKMISYSEDVASLYYLTRYPFATAYTQYSYRNESGKVLDAFYENCPFYEYFLYDFSNMMNNKSDQCHIVKIDYPYIKPNIIYEGNAKDGKFDGKGKKYTELGVLLFDGKFKNDEFYNGKLYYANSTQLRYKGGMNGYALNGSGTLYNIDGSKKDAGKFKNQSISMESDKPFSDYFDNAVNNVGFENLFSTPANADSIFAAAN